MKIDAQPCRQGTERQPEIAVSSISISTGREGFRNMLVTRSTAERPAATI